MQTKGTTAPKRAKPLCRSADQVRGEIIVPRALAAYSMKAAELMATYRVRVK